MLDNTGDGTTVTLILKGVQHATRKTARIQRSPH